MSCDMDTEKWEFHITSSLSAFALPRANNVKSFFPPLSGNTHLFGGEIRAIHHSWACGACDRSCGEADLDIETLSAFCLLPVFTANSKK